MLTVLLAVSVLLCAPLLQDEAQDQLEKPALILAGEEPINVDVGHSAPFVYDFDGDGRKDLLVGQFGEGKLRIYRNKGSNKAPKFEDFTWFQDGTEKGRVPTG